MRSIILIALAFLAPAALPSAQAGVAVGGAVVVSPGGGYRGGWAGGPYRPWVGAGYGHGYYGGWRHGYPGYGYPGYGYGFGYGAGWGLGYGIGWGLATATPWSWGAPAVLYNTPAFYPYGVVALPTPAFEVQDRLTYVQQAPAPAADATPPAPAAQAQPGYWYYCTEPPGYHPYVQQCARPWIAVNPNSRPSGDAAGRAGTNP